MIIIKKGGNYLMARSQLLLKLVQAGKDGDKQLFYQTVEAIIAEEASKNHHVLAERLRNIINSIPSKTKNNQTSFVSFSNNLAHSLLDEIHPKIRLDELVLSEYVRDICMDFIEEHFRRDLLRSFNLEPRNRILLAGPPGNGKTSIAEALAYELMVPLFVVRYDSLIGKYLGETSTRMKQLFNEVKTQNCVLFFDEFDAIGKERGDINETGEIKRIVSSLLLEIDNLPSHVVIVTATNHPELLDKAVWRRFQIKLEIHKPDRYQIEKWLEEMQIQLGIYLGYTSEYLAKELHGLSFAEIKEFLLSVKRRAVLSMQQDNAEKIVKKQLDYLKKQYKSESGE